ncbi:MAG: DegT/DnrJ/EryC1/StrS family aminotransferase [Candidatus Zixiibacteriota bacterium]
MKISSVPFYRLKISKAEIDKVNQTLRSGWLTTGKVTQQFETEFAEYVGAQYAVAVNSCTAALHLSLIAAGVGPGDEVITTPYTFVATTETIIQCGARVVFVDTERDSFNINLDQLEKAITPRTKAIVPVYIAGYPSDLRRIEAIRKKHKVAVIHDAAHALGTVWGKTMVGSTPDLTCFSFYSTKNLTTGEGGMITTNCKKHMEQLRIIALHGMSKGAWNRYTGAGSWKYQILALGYKYNLPDMASSLGLIQLRNFERMQSARRRAAGLYGKYLSDVEELILPQEPESGKHAWHLYIVKLRTGGEKLRDRVIEELKAAGIGTSVHFIPLYLHPYYKKHYGQSRREFPNSFAHYQGAITLPLFVDIKEEEIKYVADSLRKILQRSRKK